MRLNNTGIQGLPNLLILIRYLKAERSFRCKMILGLRMIDIVRRRSWTRLFMSRLLGLMRTNWGSHFIGVSKLVEWFLSMNYDENDRRSRKAVLHLEILLQLKR